MLAGRLGLLSAFGFTSMEGFKVVHGAAQQLFVLYSDAVGGSSRDRPIHVVVVAVGVVTIVIAVIVVVAIIVVVIMIIIIFIIIIMKPRGRLRFEGGPRTFAFHGVRPPAPFGMHS